MTSWVDNEFAERLLCTFPRFRRVSAVPFKLNCRCPICGDSAKDEFKARFWAYEHKKSGLLRVHCFNCDEDLLFSKFLQNQDESLYREYVMEKRKERLFTSGTKEPTNTGPSEKITSKLVIEKLDYCERLDRLPKDHPIVRYVKNRRIPESKWNRLWFTTQWPALCNSIKPGTYAKELNEPRLVIPIYNKDKKMESFQGRALRKDAPQKYITIKAHDDATKIYGLDTVDGTKDVFAMEGPIDSLFLDNAIAITGGSLDLNTVPFKDTRIWVLDNEPRHPDTAKRVKKLVEAGERVAFWDKAPWKSKDVNDMVMKENADPHEIKEYLLANTESGLMAKLRMNRVFKV